MTAQGYELLVICGLHRSGTTFAGEILRHAGSIPIVHEPLNERFGVAGVPIAYPYVDADGTGECAPFAKLIEDIVSFSRGWNKDTKHIQANSVLRMLYSLTGGRSGIRWGGLRLRHMVSAPPRCLCWKDPFASLSTPYLLARHGARIVCMIRHPAAIHYSTMKQQWWFDVDNLVRQHALIDNHGRDIRQDQWDLARQNHAASIALLWKLMVRINVPLAEKEKRLLIVRHENLCRDPERTAEKIITHLGMDYTPSVRRYVVAMSSGTNSEGDPKKVHSFFRDSRAVADSWRGKLSSSEEDVMQGIIGDDFLRCYTEW